MSLREETISGVKWTTVTTVTLAIVSVLKISVLARFLEAEAFGLMALIIFFLGFLDLFMDMGLTTAILHKQKISMKEYASLYWVNFIFSLLLFGIITMLSPLIANFYSEAELNYFLPLASISIILSASGRQFKVIKQKEMNFRFIAITEISSALSGLFIGIYCAVNGYGVLSLIFAYLIQFSISNVIYFINGIFTRGLLFHFNLNEAKPFLKIGMYDVGGQIINYFSRDVDILLIGKFLGAEVLGAYSLARQLVRRPSRIINPVVTSVAGPALSLIQDKKEQLKKEYLSFLNVISTANFTAYFLLAIFAYPIVYLLYGEEFMHIDIIVQILCIWMYLRAVGDSIGPLVIATGRTDIEFYWNLVVLFISPIVIYISVQFSVIVVAASISITMFFLTIIAWRVMIYRMIKATWQEYFTAFVPRWIRIYNLIVQEFLPIKRKEQK